VCDYDVALTVFVNVLIDKWTGINKNLLLICNDICNSHFETDEIENLVTKFYDNKSLTIFNSKHL